MKLGIPMYQASRDSRWYYWIDGKQSYPSGNVLAVTRLGAKREIRIQHPGCKFDRVMHQSEYHSIKANLAHRR